MNEKKKGEDEGVKEELEEKKRDGEREKDRREKEKEKQKINTKTKEKKERKGEGKERRKKGNMSRGGELNPNQKRKGCETTCSFRRPQLIPWFNGLSCWTLMFISVAIQAEHLTPTTNLWSEIPHDQKAIVV